MDNMRKEGYLLKGGKVSWKKYYFLMDTNMINPKLSYYEDEEQCNSKPKGVFYFSSHVKYSRLTNGSKPNCFELKTNNWSKRLLLHAEQKKEFEAWEFAIGTLIYNLQTISTYGRCPRKSCYFFALKGERFEMTKNYIPINKIGQGSYGVVISAQDEKTKMRVAVKKISRTFNNLHDTRRIVREVRILRHLKHENIIQLIDLPIPPRKHLFEDIYIVTDLMSFNLRQLIRSDQSICNDHIRYICVQILRALKYLHSAGIMHRDIKPDNILINREWKTKICDFGNSISINAPSYNNGRKLTEYVSTRWYRAPEIMLCNYYTEAIDVWSLGCIMAELIQRRPLFPGKNYEDQITHIIHFLGKPEITKLNFINNKRAKKFVTGLPHSNPRCMESYFSGSDNMGLCVLRKLLELNPAQRISVADSLEHSYFYPGRDASAEIYADTTIDLASIDKAELARDSMQCLLYDEIGYFHSSPESMKEITKLKGESPKYLRILGKRKKKRIYENKKI